MVSWCPLDFLYQLVRLDNILQSTLKHGRYVLHLTSAHSQFDRHASKLPRTARSCVFSDSVVLEARMRSRSREI